MTAAVPLIPPAPLGDSLLHQGHLVTKKKNQTGVSNYLYRLKLVITIIGYAFLETAHPLEFACSTCSNASICKLACLGYRF